MPNWPNGIEMVLDIFFFFLTLRWVDLKSQNPCLSRGLNTWPPGWQASILATALPQLPKNPVSYFLVATQKFYIWLLSEQKPGQLMNYTFDCPTQISATMMV